MAESTFKHTDKNSTEKDVTDEKFMYAEKCGICESDYQTPKSLKCLHSFCQKCLAEKVNAGKNTVTCPNCDAVTKLPSKGVDGLNTNFMLIEKHERNLFEKQLKEKDTFIPCTSCKNDSKNKAIAWCRQCQDYMCEAAVKYHKELRITNVHEIIGLEILRSEGIPKGIRSVQKERVCPRHKDEKLIFYCETCEVPFCRNCQIIDHPRGEDHVQVYLDDAVRKRIDNIKTEAEECKHVGREVDNTISQNERIEAAHLKAVEQTLNAYDDAAKEAEVRFSDKQKENRNKFSAELTRFDEKRKQDINDHKEKLKNVRSRICSVLAIAEMLTETGTQYDIADMYKDVITALRELRDFKPEAEPMSEITFKINDKCHSIVESIPAPGILTLGVIGKNAWEQKRKFGSGNLSGARGLTFTPTSDIIVADNTARAAKLFDGEGTLSKTITQGTAGFNYPFDVFHSSDGYFYMTDQAYYVKQINSEINYSGTRTISNKYTGYGIAAMKNDNWAVCCKDYNLIFVYNSSGNQVQRISVMDPNFIAITSKDNVVISSQTQKSVQVVAADGQLLQVIGPPPDVANIAWSPQGVCCSKSDEIYVANQGTEAMGIYRFKVSGEFIDCITTDLNNPWGLAISADGHQLAVVDENGASVKVFSQR
ncbi:E3 ubiquitin-protein ligase TRIM71-like [Amphiura filiformis]|uniref:E3 ubiquitin-protein ligase TRIM71-like n=1 Tax=Amphiura filiformis TaxID=82378 RepID=UPI003B2186F1